MIRGEPTHLDAVAVLVLGAIIVLLFVSGISSRPVLGTIVGGIFAVIALCIGVFGPTPSLAVAGLCAVGLLALLLVPALAGVSVIRSWSGIDGGMPDGIPVIGPSGTTPRLIHAFGFSGHGFQLGPAIGAILSELVLDGRTEVPLAPFAIQRWATHGVPAAVSAD